MDEGPVPTRVLHRQPARAVDPERLGRDSDIAKAVAGSSLCAKPKPKSVSRPGVSFNHSTTTDPLNLLGSVGMRTIMRDLYEAVDAGATLHLPSSPHVPVGVYADAYLRKWLFALEWGVTCR